MFEPKEMDVTLAQRVEAEAYRASVRNDVGFIAQWLLDTLGQRITAVGLGLSDATMVRQYAQGSARPHQDRSARMRLLYRVARTLTGAFDPETARAFLISANPQLGERAPLVVIADEDPKHAAPDVLGAVRAVIDG